MSNKSTVTRKAALEFVMALPEVQANAEVSEVLGKMYASITKPRVKSDLPSKARRENEQLLATLLEAIARHGEPVTSKWVTEHVRGMMTPQKVTAVAKIGIENGTLVRTKEGKVITYSLAE